MNIFKNRIAKNASWIIISKIIQSILGLIISMFTARFFTGDLEVDLLDSENGWHNWSQGLQMKRYTKGPVDEAWEFVVSKPGKALCLSVYSFDAKVQGPYLFKFE